LGALILIGGYVAYDHWKETNREDRECAALKRSFVSNMNSMMGPADTAIAESNRIGNQSPMGSLAGNVAANQAVMDALNARCPGWQEKQYRN
jgi:hypothetical protein